MLFFLLLFHVKGHRVRLKVWPRDRIGSLFWEIVPKEHWDGGVFFFNVKDRLVNVPSKGSSVSIPHLTGGIFILPFCSFVFNLEM